MPLNLGQIAKNAAASAAGGGFFGSIFGNIGAKRRQKAADASNLKFWMLQNFYNHPSQQMKRLKEAGLNPNLIYGTSPSSAVGAADSIAPSKAAPFNFNIPNPMANLLRHADVQKRDVETDNLRLQAAVIGQEATLKAAQTAQLAATTARSRFDLGLAEELRNTSVDAAKENVRLMQQQTIEKQINNEIKDQTKKAEIIKVFYEVANAKEQLTGNKLVNELHRFEIKLNKYGLSKRDSLFWRIMGHGYNQLQFEFKNRLPGVLEKAANINKKWTEKHQKIKQKRK